MHSLGNAEPKPKNFPVKFCWRPVETLGAATPSDSHEAATPSTPPLRPHRLSLSRRSSLCPRGAPPLHPRAPSVQQASRLPLSPRRAVTSSACPARSRRSGSLRPRATPRLPWIAPARSRTPQLPPSPRRVATPSDRRSLLRLRRHSDLPLRPCCKDLCPHVARISRPTRLFVGA
jgi:hypothetical protein